MQEISLQQGFSNLREELSRKTTGKRDFLKGAYDFFVQLPNRGRGLPLFFI